jgi:2-aminoadipate transaminase
MELRVSGYRGIENTQRIRVSGWMRTPPVIAAAKAGKCFWATGRINIIDNITNKKKREAFCMGNVSFLRGVPAEEALAAVTEAVAQGYARALKGYGAQILQYQTPGITDFNGFIPLKEALAQRFGLSDAVNKRVICFNGGMEVFSLLLKSFPRGTRVATEALTYDRALADVLRYEHQVVGIPFGIDGIDLDILEKELSKGEVKLFYRIIYHQNPTGLDSTMENIEAAAQLCARYNALYVCDIAYYELRYDGKKNQLLDLSKFPTSCLIGSFTKTLSPGTKCGFGIFPENVVDQLTPVIANTRLNPNYPTQAMIHHLIDSGEYDKYLGYLVGFYRPRLDALNRALELHFPEPKRRPVTGGFFTGIWLAGIQDEGAFIEAAKANGVTIAPAAVFAPGWKIHYWKKKGGPFFRLTFPSLSSENIAEGVARLGQAYGEMKRTTR